MWICINMQKLQMFHLFALDLIWLIKKSCNLLGWEHCDTYLKNEIFAKYFHHRTNSVKIHDQVFNKLKKPYFWPIFSIFGGKNFFPKKSGSAMYNFISVSSTMPKLQKKTDTIPKRADRRKDDRNGGQTLFYRTLSATARGSSKGYLQ